jgi:hypothetical protein
MILHRITISQDRLNGNQMLWSNLKSKSIHRMKLKMETSRSNINVILTDLLTLKSTPTIELNNQSTTNKKLLTLPNISLITAKRKELMTMMMSLQKTQLIEKLLQMPVKDTIEKPSNS